MHRLTRAYPKKFAAYRFDFIADTSDHVDVPNSEALAASILNPCADPVDCGLVKATGKCVHFRRD